MAAGRISSAGGVSGSCGAEWTSNSSAGCLATWTPLSGRPEGGGVNYRASQVATCETRTVTD